MIIATLFTDDTGFTAGEVEIKLMPGIPRLVVVGLPDRSMREAGLRLKSALRSAGFRWPRGHQIVVNLRPSYVRKQSLGVDLAIALGVLSATKQLAPKLAAALEGALVYGELTLDGRVFAPADVARALAAAGDRPLLTGATDAAVDGAGWLELAHLGAPDVHRRVGTAAPELTPPSLADFTVAETAFEALWLSAHLGLSVLVAGPQGSGKSTWARAVHALSPPPDPGETRARAALFGPNELARPWRPLEQPHHTTPALAMIGGGRPLRPGVISRAHGGTLVMDEFLEFDPHVLEALREPMESGEVELARVGKRERLPARIQLIATSNLCPCGELNPMHGRACARPLPTCRRTSQRLSGPLLDRFDLLVLSHEWLGLGPRVRMHDAPAKIEATRAFALRRGEVAARAYAEDLGLSHRRRRAIGRIARALADAESAGNVAERHFGRAYALVVTPMERLRRLFA